MQLIRISGSSCGGLVIEGCAAFPIDGCVAFSIDDYVAFSIDGSATFSIEGKPAKIAKLKNSTSPSRDMLMFSLRSHMLYLSLIHI